MPEKLQVEAVLIVAAQGCEPEVFEIPQEFLYAEGSFNSSLQKDAPEYCRAGISRQIYFPLRPRDYMNERIASEGAVLADKDSGLYTIEMAHEIGIREAKNLLQMRIKMMIADYRRLTIDIRPATMEDIRYVQRNGGMVPTKAANALKTYDRITNPEGD